MKLLKVLISGSIAFGLSACSTTGPIIYPNTYFLSMGKAAAEKDIEACRKLAESAGAREGDGKLGNVATSTAMGAGVGAASGAVAGLLRGVLLSSKSSQPNQAYINFVSRCLEEKGYEVTGWQ